MKAEQGFQFERFEAGNPWRTDVVLRLALLRLCSSLPGKEIEGIFGELDRFGERVVGEYADIAATLDGPAQEPTLVQYDAWGRRIDRLSTGEGWRRLKDVAASEGLVANSYGSARDRYGKFARLFAFTRIIMFSPVSKMVLCPVSMSDGAARVLELFGSQEQREDVLQHLCSTNAHKNWTAGQWMTERPGGSDVSRTETVARHVQGRKYNIDGFKWFSSATDGDVALALARTDPDTSKGSKGLSLFLIKIRDSRTGKLNGIRIHRLKKKFGTRYLPTAELELEGCEGELVGELGRGVATIASVLNITRLYSAAGAIGGLSWGLRSATAYAAVRPIAGEVKLSQLPLHNDQLLKVTILYRACLQIFLHTVLLLGAVETGQATRREHTRLRLLTPALKAFVATRGSDAYLTLMESFGGQGYMQEVGIGEMVQDLSVERIWEGTPSILSLDVLRVHVQTEGRAVSEYLEDIEQSLNSLNSAISRALRTDVQQLRSIVDGVRSLLNAVDLSYHLSSNDLRFSRPLLDLLMAVNAAVLLLQQASWMASSPDLTLAGFSEKDAAARQVEEDIEVARLWISGGHGDLQRLLEQLRSATGSRDTSLTRRIVYAWKL